MFEIFPSNFIFWHEVKNHEQIKKIYLPKILSTQSDIKHDNSWLCDVNTSFGDRNQELNNLVFDDNFVQNVIWETFDIFLQNRPYNFCIPKKSYVHNIWYNIYQQGQYQEIHNHLGKLDYIVENCVYEGMFSGIYILDSEEKNKTIFYQPGPNPCTRSMNGIKVTTEHIKEGNVIIFPSGLLHYTMPAEKSRTIISFNIVSSFE